MQLHQNEIVLVKTRSAAADMKNVHVTNKLTNKQIEIVIETWCVYNQ